MKQSFKFTRRIGKWHVTFHSRFGFSAYISTNTNVLLDTNLSRLTPRSISSLEMFNCTITNFRIDRSTSQPPVKALLNCCFVRDASHFNPLIVNTTTQSRATVNRFCIICPFFHETNVQRVSSEGNNCQNNLTFKFSACYKSIAFLLVNTFCWF